VKLSLMGLMRGALVLARILMGGRSWSRLFDVDVYPSQTVVSFGDRCSSPAFTC